jgi:hypothetical protein
MNWFKVLCYGDAGRFTLASYGKRIQLKETFPRRCYGLDPSQRYYPSLEANFSPGHVHTLEADLDCRDP